MFDSVTPARMSKEMANLTTLLIEKKSKKWFTNYSQPAICNHLAQKYKSLVKTILMQRIKLYITSNPLLHFLLNSDNKG